MRITVLVGGTSAERDVSLATGAAIVRALQTGGHQVRAIDTGLGRLIDTSSPGESIAAEVGTEPPLPAVPDRSSGGLTPPLHSMALIEDTEAVFIALHGGAGEDGRLQALLDLVEVPYTGSGYLGSALAMDKLVSKELLARAGVPTPPWLVAPCDVETIQAELGGFPVIVKPSREGSTVGVGLVKEPGQLDSAVAKAERFHGRVIIERFIPGRELAVGVLGDEALPVVEIVPSHEIYDYECKYTKGRSEYRVPAPLEEEERETVQRLALLAHRTLRLSGYSRVDFRLDPEGSPWCLEANSLPGMTETSLLPKAARAAGIEFEELCERIVQLAVARGVDDPGPRG